MSGFITIKIKYKGAQVAGSPFSVYVPSSRPVVQISGKPFGIAFQKGNMFVADTPNGNVIEIAPNLVQRNLKTGLNSPRGITVNATGDLIVADAFNNRLVVISAVDGKDKAAIGIKGTADGQFAVPRYALPLPDESVLICDTDNSRLQIFSKSGTFLKKIGRDGAGNGEFKFPLSAALNPVTNNEIAIADSDNFRVQFFDLNLNYTGEIGKVNDPVNNKHQFDLRTPNSVAYDSQGNLFVSELKGNCIRVFSPSKKNIHSFGKEGSGVGELRGPRYVTITPEGAVCVADHDNNRIQFF
jgi:tripartite motif-containing protein 71